MQQRQPAGAGPSTDQSYWQRISHIQQHAGANPGAQRPMPSFSILMFIACFVVFCCGCLFGIIAFIFAGKSQKIVVESAGRPTLLFDRSTA